MESTTMYSSALSYYDDPMGQYEIDAYNADLDGDDYDYADGDDYEYESY
jgi:hypothetical protein